MPKYGNRNGSVKRQGDPDPAHPKQIQYRTREPETSYDEKGNLTQLGARKQRQLQNGMVIGNIRIRKIVKVDSKFNMVYYGPPTDSKGAVLPPPPGRDVYYPEPVAKTQHATGKVECTCLLCKRQFTTRNYRLRPNCIKKSLYSCGCKKRPYVRRPGSHGGRKPTDIEPGMVIARLTVIMWVAKHGWLCKCICGESIVVKPKSLKKQSIRGCRQCDSIGWSRRRGPRKRLMYIDGKLADTFSGLEWWQYYE
jgi:hypothetical protein